MYSALPGDSSQRSSRTVPDDGGSHGRRDGSAPGNRSVYHMLPILFYGRRTEKRKIQLHDGSDVQHRRRDSICRKSCLCADGLHAWFRCQRSLSVAFECGVMVPHGGIFVIWMISRPVGFLIALSVGSLVTMIAMSIGVKREPGIGKSSFS